MPRQIVVQSEIDAASLMMRRMRAQRGGAEKIAQALALNLQTVKGWEAVPACHFRRFNAAFGNRLPSTKIVPSPRLQSTERVRRQCLCCGARFVADGRWLRLCKPCRGRC
ncbi:hypothetical protein C0V97_09150 [Asaia sp. W19]|uniref:hypothetical protein n=1 Tax=unclassified Asaia TaxID=2685023 RepID=UPI000F8C81FF|nr:hypothetical protein [Asaia sp. W19]RUT25990.1 hypothetical protein C0V97_09150 [Asaia sp. W19]